jgi:hypothetical protein
MVVSRQVSNWINYALTMTQSIDGYFRNWLTPHPPHSSRHSLKETMDEGLGELSIKDLVSSHCLVHHQQYCSPQALPNRIHQPSEETPLSLLSLWSISLLPSFIFRLQMETERSKTPPYSRNCAQGHTRLSSQYIWFPSGSPRVVNNFEVKLWKELELSGLSLVQELHCSEIFQILIVR